MILASYLPALADWCAQATEGRGLARKPAPGRNALRQLAAAGLTLGLCAPSPWGLCSIAHAQELIPGELITGESLQGRFDRRQPPIGARLGNIWLRPALQYDHSLDNNIFATPSQRRGDMIMTVSGAATADYASGPDSWRLTGTIFDHNYAFTPSQNEWEGGADGIIRHQIFHDLQLNAGGGIHRSIQPRTDPTGLNGINPTTYQVYDAFGGLLAGDPLNNQLELKVGATRVVYNSLQGLTGPIDTAERNFRELSTVLRFEHSMFGQQKLFAEIRPNDRAYDREFDDNGFDRSSKGVRAATGIVFDLDSVILVTLGTGFQAQAYDDSRFGTISEPTGTIKISWWPTLLTNVNLDFIHEYQEEFFATSPGSVRNLVNFHLDHELRRNILLSATASFDFRNLVTSGSGAIREQRLGAKVEYQFGDRLGLIVNYFHARQRGSGGIVGFDKDVFDVSLKKLF